MCAHYYINNANNISITPPTHEKSWCSEEIFFPVRLPRRMAINPQKTAQTDVLRGDVTENPLLSPIAAESNELASARAAASTAERLFELSKSAAVSSKYSFRTIGLFPIFIEISPFSERRSPRLRTRLLKIVTAPIKVSIPTLRV